MRLSMFKPARERATDWRVGAVIEGFILDLLTITHTGERGSPPEQHQWRTGDFVIWDDRATLHAATADRFCTPNPPPLDRQR